MSLPKYVDKNWILTSSRNIYERKPFSPDLLNGYFNEFLATAPVTQADMEAWIEDPRDESVQNFKRILDYYNLVRVNVNYIAHKDVASASLSQTTIDHFKSLKGITSSSKLFYTVTDFIPIKTEILINDFSINVQKNGKSIANVQFIVFGGWTVERISP